MDWDDYRYFAALAEAGSVRGAANELGVNASTVTRRLESLETALGVSLFKRTGRGLNITTEGVEVAQRLDEVAKQLRILEASVKGRDSRLAGQIKLSVPDVFGVHFLLADLVPFIQMYSEIQLDLVPGAQVLALGKDDLDVQISVTDNPPDWLVGRPLGQLSLGVYGTAEYVASIQAGERAGADIDWVGWDQRGEIGLVYQQIKTKSFAEASEQVRVGHAEMQRAALRAGMGIGILPSFVGEQDELLQSVPDVEGASPNVWLLTHPSARAVRRIQLLLEFLRDVFANRQAQIFVTS